MAGGPFVIDDDTEQVEVPCLCAGGHDHDTVTIKARFSGADIAEIDSSMTRLARPDEIPHRDVEGVGVIVDLAASSLAMMAAGVVGWSFVDGDGAPIPFDRAMVNRLDNHVWSVVQSRLQTKVEDQRNPLAARSGRRIGASSGRRP